MNSEIANSDKQEIDNITGQFFALFTNTDHQPNWEMIHTICIAETIIIKKTDLTEMVYNITSFVTPRKKILSDGTLTHFCEKEIEEETKITGNIAQRFSKYEKSGYLNGKYFKEYGNKFFQFIKTLQGWKINSLIWEDDKI